MSRDLKTLIEKLIKLKLNVPDLDIYEKSFYDSSSNFLKVKNDNAFTPLDENYDRYYSRIFLNKEFFSNSNCSPPTPIDDLVSYRRQINRYASRIQGIISDLSPTNLNMKAFAKQGNNLNDYLRSLPDDYCIGEDNRDEFDDMQRATENAIGTYNRGVGIFESNFRTFVNSATSLLGNISSVSNNINSSSRDFRPVSDAVQSWDNSVQRYDIEIWNLSPTIESLGDSFNSALSTANNSVERALITIQSNCEYEANRFTDALEECNKAYTSWDTIDGLEGYNQYGFTLAFVVNTLIPDFNDFVSKIPVTDRIQAAVKKAQQAIDQMITIFESFPTFNRLPDSSDNFPYKKYAKFEQRRYGNEQIIEVVRKSCVQHFNDTNKKLYVGDLSYEKGGRAKPHKSHRLGIDADVDPVEIGNIPNHKPELALAAAKRFLAAGANMIFYGDQNIVNDANAWAQENNIPGRLQFEGNHKRHFHLRV